MIRPPFSFYLHGYNFTEVNSAFQALPTVNSERPYFSTVLESIFLPTEVIVSAIFFEESGLPMLENTKRRTFFNIMTSVILLRVTISLTTMVLYIPSK